MLIYPISVNERGFVLGTSELARLLKDKEEPFFKKLKHAANSEIEYWEKRPENLSREMLLKYLRSIDETRLDFPSKIEKRKSAGGKYGQTGFNYVFVVEDKFRVAGKVINIYLKGFFFEEEDPRGVEIQSFKVSNKLRSIK